MNYSQRALALIKNFEGYRTKAYPDARGIPTIGYGHTIGVKIGQQVTQKQADRLLAIDLDTTCKAVLSLAKVTLTQGQLDALVCFAYNVGCGAFGKSTLLAKLNAGDYAGAANQFPKWNMCEGKPLAGLTHRRAAERALFLQPVQVAAA